MNAPLEKRRNIGILAHIDAGKTTTTERLLYYAGRTYKMGEVDEGTTVTDWMPEEQRRGITITAAATDFVWRDCLVTLIDTPGHVDFTAEVERSLRVLDGAVIVLCGVGGVEAQTETVWRQADRYRVPRLAFINKLDRLGSDFFRVVREIEDRLGATPLVTQLPVGRERDFRGVVDLVNMEMVLFDGSPPAIEQRRQPVVPELLDEARRWREKLEEQVAERVETLTEKYLDVGRLDETDLRTGIRAATLSLKGVPVLCGSALKCIGVQLLLDAVCDYLPSPGEVAPAVGRDPDDEKREIECPPDPEAPLVALAFKVAFDRYDELVYLRIYSGRLRQGRRVYNPRQNKKEIVSRIYRMLANRKEEQLAEAGPGDIVAVSGFAHTVTGDTLCESNHAVVLEPMRFPPTVMSMAIEPRSQADRDRLVESLRKFAREDPTFEVKNDPETGQLVVSGMGELHLEVIKHRLLEDFGVDANVGEPRVAYKETIAAESEAEGRVIQQTGQRGAFAVVRLRVRPAELGGAVRFLNLMPAATPPKIRHRFVAAIERGVLDTARGGVVTGYPLINVEALLLDAEEHPVDSDDVAFEAAASMALRRAVESVGAVLLEPVMSLEAVAPAQYLGDIIADLNARRADIRQVGERGELRVVSARVPLSEMFGYSTALRSLTQGRGSYTLEPSGYQQAPRKVYERWVL